MDYVCFNETLRMWIEISCEFKASTSPHFSAWNTDESRRALKEKPVSSRRQETTDIAEVVKKETLHIVSGNVNGVATMENDMQVPQKTKNRTPRWSNNSTPVDTQRTRRQDLDILSAPMFTAALFTVAKMLKQPKCPLTMSEL